MNKVTHFALCFIFVAICLMPINVGSASRSSGTGSRSSMPNRMNTMNRNYYGGYERPIEEPKPQTPKEYLDSNSGLSTFGIIAIIFFAIMACLLFYYGIMCYPFLCRDEKKYHFMDVSSTITAATSRSMQSIENYPDSKLEKSCV